MCRLIDSKLLDPIAAASGHHNYIMVLQILLFLAMCFFGDVRMAQAASVQVKFSGTVNSILGSGVPGVVPGDPVSGTLIYNSTITDGNPSPQIGYYPDAITSLTVSIGSKSYSLVSSAYLPRSEIAIEDDVPLFGQYTDYIRYLGAVFETGNSIFHYLQLGFRTTAGTPSSWIGTSSALPTNIDLNAADSAVGHIRLDPLSASDAASFTISNATLSVIQNPAAILLLME